MTTRNKKTLTDRQRLFCEHYAITGNGAASARKAGYSQKAAKEAASSLLTNSNVQNEIRKKQQTYIQKTQVDKDFVLEKLVHWAKQDDPKLASASIKALELLGKYLRMWDGDIRNVEHLTHEQALKHLE